MSAPRVIGHVRCEHCGHNQEVDVPLSILDEIEAAIPSTFFAGCSLIERVTKLVEMWQRAIDLIDDEDDDAAKLYEARLGSLIAEERAKPAPKTWAAGYGQGYNDALTQVLDWLGVET